MKYMILGGGGSFGIHTARYLLEQPETQSVIGVGRSPLRAEPFSLNVDRNLKYQYKTLHLTHEFDLFLDFFSSEWPDVIINFAAQGEGAASWRHSWRYYETNCVTLARLVEQLLGDGTISKWGGRFIHIGTSELYGAVEQPSLEDDPLKPTSPYAASKAAFDMHLLSMHRVMDFNMNIIRPSNAYCPGQQLHRVIPRAMVAGITGVKLPLRGGAARKSYIHARDLARAIHLVTHQGVHGEIYNVGPELPISIRKLVELCADALGMPFDELVQEYPERVGEDAQYWLSSAKIQRLGWKQEISLQQGLTEMAAWARRYHGQLANCRTDFEMRA